MRRTNIELFVSEGVHLVRILGCKFRNSWKVLEQRHHHLKHGVMCANQKTVELSLLREGSCECLDWFPAPETILLRLKGWKAGDQKNLLLLLTLALAERYFAHTRSKSFYGCYGTVDQTRLLPV